MNNKIQKNIEVVNTEFNNQLGTKKFEITMNSIVNKTNKSVNLSTTITARAELKLRLVFFFIKYGIINSPNRMGRKKINKYPKLLIPNAEKYFILFRGLYNNFKRRALSKPIDR